MRLRFLILLGLLSSQVAAHAESTLLTVQVQARKPPKGVKLESPVGALAPQAVWGLKDWPAVIVRVRLTIPVGSRVLGTDQNPAPLEGQVAVAPVPLTAFEQTSQLKLVRVDGNVELIELRLKATATGANVYTSPECAKVGASIRPLEPELPAVVFFECGDKGVTRASTFIGGAWTKAPPSWAASKPARGVAGRAPQGDQPPIVLELLAPGGKSAGKFDVRGSVLASRWMLLATMGPSYVSYTETAPKGTIALTQIGITAKAQGLYRFAPPRWDFAFSVFGTVAPISHSPEGIAGARWLGLNGRVSYSTPLDGAGRSALAIMPGFYAWSMYVDGHGYGVEKLNGPQLLIQFSRQYDDAGDRFGTYLKYAAMASGLSLTGFANREVAIGLWAVGIHPKLPRRLSVAMDFSTMHFAQGSFAADLQTASLAFGLSVL